MNSYLIVFFGAGVGGAFRHGVNGVAAVVFGINFPSGTLIVNILGSFLMGALIHYFGVLGEASQYWRLFLTTGVLGGFTTFSAFSLDTVLLYQRGEPVQAALYVLISVLASISALFFGIWVMRYSGL